jgi:hypothetical protein
MSNTLGSALRGGRAAIHDGSSGCLSVLVVRAGWSMALGQTVRDLATRAASFLRVVWTVHDGAGSSSSPCRT